ncbi:dCTP deaminase [Candidatus Gracilibacteria bacterium CG2_30_37_12]|nr:MAG: dCTP deaminase [Candidatus Gracilibacteria bacterium CG2_30_37_12]
MFLSDIDIKKAIVDQSITLSDFDPKRLGPASYDILLGNKFLVIKSHSTSFIDPVNKILPEYDEIILKDNESFTLHPGVSILGISHDYFGSDKYLIQLSGKSSLARIGLIVHNTAGLINPGHYLNIVFELCNLNSVPIILRPKMEIAQLIFAEMSSVPEVDYKETGRYHGKNWTSYTTKE